MKQAMKSILKKQVLLISSIFVLVGLNVYFLTFPSKILGTIIDLV